MYNLSQGCDEMQKILSYMRKAIEDYNMIKNGDKIAVRIIWRKRFYNLTYGPKSNAKILS